MTFCVNCHRVYTIINMSYIKLSQAAQLLGVSSRTLMRWDEEGVFPAYKEPLSGAKFYEESVIKAYATLFDLERAYKSHLKKLPSISKEVKSYLPTEPLNPAKTPEPKDFKGMKKAFEDLHGWEQEHRDFSSKLSNARSTLEANIHPDNYVE